jgi:hypothetical protein
LKKDNLRVGGQRTYFARPTNEVLCFSADELSKKKSVILLQDPRNLSKIARVFAQKTNGKARLHTDLLPYYAISV